MWLSLHGLLLIRHGLVPAAPAKGVVRQDFQGALVLRKVLEKAPSYSDDLLPLPGGMQQLQQVLMRHEILWRQGNAALVTLDGRQGAVVCIVEFRRQGKR